MRFSPKFITRSKETAKAAPPNRDGDTMSMATSTETHSPALHVADSHDLIRVQGASENNPMILRSARGAHRYSPKCPEKRRMLRSSRLQSPPAQPRSSSYRTTLRPLWSPNRSVVDTFVARIRYERLRLATLLVPENFHAP